VFLQRPILSLFRPGLLALACSYMAAAAVVKVERALLLAIIVLVVLPVAAVVNISAT
jgi:hypothetical protein